VGEVSKASRFAIQSGHFEKMVPGDLWGSVAQGAKKNLAKGLPSVYSPTSKGPVGAVRQGGTENLGVVNAQNFAIWQKPTDF